MSGQLHTIARRLVGVLNAANEAGVIIYDPRTGEPVDLDLMETDTETTLAVRDPSGTRWVVEST